MTSRQWTLASLCVVLVWSFATASRVEADRTSPSQSSGPGPIYVATYDGVINPVAAEYITESIRKANDAGAGLLIVQLDTPGGLDTSMRSIIKEINRSEVPVAVYVAPSGARAASAGVFITVSAHVAAMAPGTNIGAAHPVAMGGGTMDDVMKKKVENDAAAYIRSIAEKRGRNAQWAEDSVRKSVSITEKEAVKQNVVDLTSESLSSLISSLNGREVVTATGPKIIHTAGAAQKEIPMAKRLRILNLLSDPNIAYVLMILGIYGLFFELASPGAILPGVVGAIFLVLAFYAFQALPVNYAGLLLIILGIIMFIAEIKVTSYGLLSVGGVISMMLGSLMLMNTDVPFLKISWSVILPMVLLSAGFFLFSVRMAVKAHGKRPVTGKEALIGAVGEADTDIAPVGKAFFHGEIWDAKSDETIRKGEKIEVVSMQGFTANVKKVGGFHG